MISGPKSRNLPKFCTFSRKIALFRKKSHFSALFAPKRKKRARLPGPIKTNAFYRYFELIFAKRRKCAEFCVFARNFRFFAHFFAFFAPKWKKSQKCVLSEKYLSVPLTKRIYIYVFFPGSKENQLFRTFPTFSFLGRLEWKKCSGAQKSAKIRFFAPKSGKCVFCVLDRKTPPRTLCL